MGVVDNDPPNLETLGGVSSLRDRLTKQLYSAPELMRLAGISRKQVDYWARIGLITPKVRRWDAPPGQPSLLYAGTEVVKALIICDLRHRGFSLRQVQQVARNLEEHSINLYEAEAYVLTDGHSVYYAFSNNEVVDVLKRHRQMLLLVPVHEQIAKLREVA